MSAAIKFDPPYVRDLGDNPGTVEFNNIQELRTWIEAEQDNWKRIFGNTHDDSFHETVKSRQRDTITNLFNLTNEFISSHTKTPPNDEEILKFRDRISKRPNQYENHLSTHASSKNGVQALSHEDNAAALSALALLAPDRRELRSQENFKVLPFLEAWSSLRSQEKINRASAIAFEEAARSAANSLAAKSAEHAQLVAEERSLGEAHRKEIEDARVALAVVASESTERYRAALAAHETALSELRAYYKEHLAVAEIVKFWDEKEEAHKGGMALWGGAFLLLMGASAIIIFDVAPAHIAKAWDGTKFDPKHLIFFTIPLLFVVWLLRVCSKMFSLNTGLRWDARERIAMGKTFLSLTRQEKGLNDQERSEVIKALFRPAAVTGSDDSPTSIVDELLKKTQSK